MMRYPALPKGKRLIAARLSGCVGRLSLGRDSGLPYERKVREIWAITEDPEILGHELGPYLAAEYPHAGTIEAILLLRAAGADEQVAETNAAWQRERRARQLGGPRT